MHTRFEKYRVTELGRRLETLIDRENRYIEYAALSRARVPAIDAIIYDLRSEFPDLPNDRTTHTFCGAMVAEVMRRHNHEVVGRGRVPNGIFKSAAIYSPLPVPLTSNLT